MEKRSPGPRWAPRVPQSAVRRLYETDARGIYDDELLDKVGWALLFRCQSFIDTVEALQGRAKCPHCGTTVLHRALPDEILHCPSCNWEETWADYHKSFQHHQLSGAEPVLILFREFIASFPQASSPRAKMLLIDGLIHGFHQDLRGAPTRTTGINLIEGRYHEVVEFLDHLTYGDGSTPGLCEIHDKWRRTINDVAIAWSDEQLKRL